MARSSGTKPSQRVHQVPVGTAKFHHLAVDQQVLLGIEADVPQADLLASTLAVGLTWCSLASDLP